ncbi:oligosaccharide flippase family protein [Microbacterium testaceum]|uniref:oligosaccharide flippase family protein n=1 Tax=Microbacterium testaceum TaxID=2033 RepID=UPI0009C09DB2|nr:oligosaccharide flippase family protein [Microbacterium testaceum]
MNRVASGGYGGVFRALGARGLTFPIGAVATLATTSLTIAAIGGENYGTLSVISTLSTLLVFADLGFGAGIINQIAVGDVRKSRAITSTAFRVLWAPALLICILGTLGTSLFSWANLLGLSGLDAHLLDWATAGCLFAFALSIPFGIGQRILVGLGKNDLAVLLGVSSSLFAVGYTACLVWWSAPPILFAMALPLGGLLANVLSFSVGARFLGLSIRDMRASRASGAMSNLFSQGLPMLVIMIALPIMFSTHRIILAKQGSATEVAMYSLAMQFYTPIWSFISIAGTALWPIFAGRRARGESSSLMAPSLIFGGLGAFAGLGVVLLGRPVGALVSHQQILLTGAVVAAVAALLLVQAVQQVPGMFLTDRHGLWFQALCVGLAAPASLALSWMLTPHFGAPTPLLVTAACVLLFQYIPGLFKARSNGRRNLT